MRRTLIAVLLVIAGCDLDCYDLYRRQSVEIAAVEEAEMTGPPPPRPASSAAIARERSVFVIREVKVGQHTVRNVTAIVNPPASDLLLGQSFLSKFGKVTLDYNRLVLVLAP